MMIVLVALACIPLVILAAAGPLLRREMTLRRWRHGHPALMPLRFALESRRGVSQLRRV